ncbi:MAG TPA: hypothetical protein VN651_16890 [Gemmatimonadaceae bacterium]|nr:hypothetical protein [Gemmatimonadaceae bacterium]
MIRLGEAGMPASIVKRSMMVCGGLCMLTAGRASAQTYWRAAVALLVEQRFFDRALWPRQRRLDIRLVPVRRGLALAVQRN